MSDVQEKGSPDNRGAYKDVREELEGVLEPPDGLIYGDDDVPLAGVHRTYDKYGIYKGGRKMAFFLYSNPPDHKELGGCVFKVHRSHSLRWELYAFLALLQGASVSLLFGQEFALFGGTHSKPYELLPEVTDAVLVEVLSKPKSMSAQQALAHARAQLTLQKSLNP